MANINDMGLPAGLPEIVMLHSPEHWVNGCLNTVTVAASGLGRNVVWSAELPREMTAADLGLIKPTFYGYTLTEMLAMCDHATLRQAIICLAARAGLGADNG